ncbi:MULTISPECIES: hypothetical protein [unclassified Granulicatella]|uniref:hypothetical protein n=1 Tax=unclassified Granulicatella TaxID=2630493 RepID=UPI001074353E|nr:MULTISPECIES: hypothetical protein [unclassified Granulicatella]MBF0780473.1 hypothetical protein [Granulicatella sp. 19428wC4_WM01]TFU95372.1 hypothetical protein E4T68_05140 [Granulicatella sp. WM01]
MTKDVELDKDKWSKMHNAISSLSGVSSTGYYSPNYYTTGHFSGYSSGHTSSVTSFEKRISDLVKISEKVKRLINEKDSDGVVSYYYHDDQVIVRTVQAQLSSLGNYVRNVDKYINDKIDHPFYEAMDKIGERLEALTITKYSTSNTIGFKRTDTITDEFGDSTTYEVTPKTITIEDFYKVDSPYKTSLKSSYMVFKNSKEYQENKLSEDQYIMAMHHTRAFHYESLNEQKQAKEFWRDIILGTGVVVLTLFCPPAGAVAGVTLASAEMYSVGTGKDWGTGRELDATERGVRGIFAVIDIIPGVKYMHSLSKAGKVGGAVAIKATIKQSLKEGFQQGIKNIDSFKGLVKNVKTYRDNVLKQLDIKLHNMVISGTEKLKSGLSKVDNMMSEAAQNF